MRNFGTKKSGSKGKRGAYGEFSSSKSFGQDTEK